MGDVKKHVLVNEATGARIECTEKFLPQWLARGFEVEAVVLPEGERKE